MSINVIKENAKAFITFIGLASTALLVNGLSGPWETELTIVSVLAATYVTWRVPNKPKPGSAQAPAHLRTDELGASSIAGIVACVVVVLLILGLASMLGLI